MDAAAWDERYAASELFWSADPNRFLAVAAAGRVHREVPTDDAPRPAIDLLMWTTRP